MSISNPLRAGLLALTALGPWASLGLAKPPNVLFVIADEWRYLSTGYGGDANVRTPALDAFARESIDCHNAVAGCAVCCPSRASIMTGQYPLTDGVYINDVHLAPQGETLAEAFAAAGYLTGYVGKWHIYGSPDGQDGRRLAFIPKDQRLGFEYWKACECTHNYNQSLYFAGDDPTPRYWKGYDATAETDDVCQFIHQHAGQTKPFFMFLSWGPPHFPLDSAPAEDQAEFAAAKIALRGNVPANLGPRAEAELRGYYAHMAALDRSFAKLLQTLKDEGIADDTIVIFTSDHGDMMYSQGMEFKVIAVGGVGSGPLPGAFPGEVRPREGENPTCCSTLPTLCPPSWVSAEFGSPPESKVTIIRSPALPTTLRPASARSFRCQ